MVDIVEIYVHWYAGRPKSQVAASLGVDRKTIRKYRAPAEAAGITPGGPPTSEADWAKLLKSWFPELASRRLNQLTWPEIEQHRDYIQGLLGVCTVTTIHQRLRDEHKLRASITSFRRWVHENLPDEAARSKVTALREDVEPGSEAQINYGFLGQWINPTTGKRHRIWAFVMVLPCSRHMFVRPVTHMDQHAWTEAHVEAFRFFGGAPRRLVPDNLKTGVDKPDLYDLKINKSYAELATYYGALVDPARALPPKDKPRVERPMPYVRESFWRGRQFTSLEHMQTEALVWARDTAGRRQSRPLDGAAPMAVFESVEAEALLPLPQTPFVLARWSIATVGPDIHIRVGRTLYSVPWKLIGRRVDVRSTATMVQIFHQDDLVKTHATLEQGKRTGKADYPPEKIAFQMKTPVWCRTQASAVGEACREVIDQLLEVNALSTGGPLWRSSTSLPRRSCPPPRSATWPPCAGCTPASPQFRSARSVSARHTSPRPSATSRSARAPTSASPRPAHSRRARRRPRGPHLGQAHPRTRPPRPAHPRRLRDAPADRHPSR